MNLAAAEIFYINDKGDLNVKKKVLSLLSASILIISALLTACGQSTADTGNQETSSAAQTSESANTTPSTDGEQIKLTYTGWGSPNEKKVTQNAIDSFMAANPNITVEYMHIPDESGSYATKLTTMVAAGQAPDASLLKGELGLNWAEEGKMVNIIELIENDPNWSIDEILPQSIYWWDEGKAIGMNGAIETFGIFYNKEMFATAGLDAPPSTTDTAWTWDEFIDVCKTLTLDGQGRNAHDPAFDQNDIQQYAVQLADWAYMQLVYSAGGQFLNDDGTQFALTEPAAIDGLQKYSDLMNVHHVMPTPVAQKNLPNMATSLMSKKVAMVLEGQWILVDLGAAGLDFGVGVAPKIGDKYTTMTLGDPLCIFADSKNPEAAYELLKWFWNPENTLELQTSGLWMPILKEWYTNPELVAKWTDNPVHPLEYTDSIMTPALEYGLPSQAYYIRNYPKIDAIVKPAIDQILLGEESAQEAMNRINEQVQGEIKGLYPRP